MPGKVAKIGTFSDWEGMFNDWRKDIGVNTKDIEAFAGCFPRVVGELRALRT